ncbi:MAG: aldo/keto reductase [Bacteroidota bacterium]
MDRIETILGNTGIKSTKLGFGTTGLRTIEQELSTKLLHTAIVKYGIKHIDTAAMYQTEEKVGIALRELNLTDEVTLSTKVGGYRDWEREINFFSFERDTVLNSIELSLKRLQVSTLDIVHVHDARPEHMADVFGSGGALDTLVSLKEEGVIRAIGMATKFMPLQIASVFDHRVDIIQTYNVYNLLDRRAEIELYPTAMEKGKVIINTAPFAGFILATGPGPNASYIYEPVPEEIERRVINMQAKCDKLDVKLTDVAMSFCFDNPVVHSTVLSTHKPSHIKNWLDMMQNPVPRETVQAVLKAGEA